MARQRNVQARRISREEQSLIYDTLMNFLKSSLQETRFYDSNEEVVYQKDGLLAVYFIPNDFSKLQGVTVTIDGIEQPKRVLEYYTIIVPLTHTPFPLSLLDKNKTFGMLAFSIHPDKGKGHGSTRAKIKLKFETREEDRIKLIFQYAEGDIEV
jgi:hypothetical protein